MKSAVTYRDIVEARKNIRQVVRHTPLEYSTTFSELVGGEVFFKYENLQKTGSFKIRGALNKIITLDNPERSKTVIAASAGNHAQGVAFAATKAGYRSIIVMPQGVSITKLTATKNYGAQIVLSGQSYDEAYLAAEKMQQENGAAFIHAFDDPAVIAGQGTVGLEIVEDLPDVETVVVPIGGGGLISGVAAALRHIKPGVKIIGVQAAGAPAMKMAIDNGSVRELAAVSTLADGIAVKHPGELTFSMVRELVDDIVLVSDEEIAEAILMMLERGKVLCEGAGAVGVAAVLHKRALIKGPTAVIISGGNIDVHTLSIIIERGLIKAGRYVRVKTVVVDKPGTLQKLLGILAETKTNVVSITHERILPRVPITQAEIQLDLETRDKEHVTEILNVLSNNGYAVTTEQYQ